MRRTPKEGSARAVSDHAPHRDTLQPVLPSQRAWPLHDRAASRAVEAAALAAAAPHALMQRAGLAVARLALAVAPQARRVWLACGPGNNGGDGLVAAMHLHRAGLAVRVSWLGDAARAPADARDALAHAQAAGVLIEPGLPSDAPEAGLVIDALLGLGSTRAPEGAILQAMALLQSTGAPCMAVDLPTGLDADTGRAPGTTWVQAAHTLSLLTLKPGLFTGQGRDASGRIWIDTLGVDASMHAAPTATLPGPADARQPFAPRLHAQHKGSFGDLIAIGGAPGMGGALRLAARAALAAGAGRVFMAALDPSQAHATDTVRPELMPRPVQEVLRPDALRIATVVCGCGGGDAVRAVLAPLLHHAPRLVLDADALNAIAADTALRAMLIARAARGQVSVLTPHPLEAARLAGCDAARVQADRIGRAQRLADELTCTVVLKGSGTVIATPGTPPAINPTGNARLASAGTGDVLAGWLAGTWARAPGLSPAAIAASAAWLHGHAAESGDARLPLRAADLIDAMALSLPAA
jgi:ADP-dependent NAD(P)H-hydrate dehydratase / NAD(P)H-hydrate epimerase